jgi:hypothetical protein
MRVAALVTWFITAGGLFRCAAARLPVPAISARARPARRHVRDRPVWHGALT